MLYMGEEWGALEPFPFFCDFEGDLADAVRNGRKSEFAEAYAQSGEDIPDPLAEETRDLATLDWSSLTSNLHANRLSLVRDLLRARKTHIVPLLTSITQGGKFRVDDGTLLVTWRAGERSLLLLANLSDREMPPRKDLPPWGQAIWGGAPPLLIAPWSVHVALGEH
jgi:1,4-alpha-glucan branching enzyme